MEPDYSLRLSVQLLDVLWMTLVGLCSWFALKRAGRAAADWRYFKRETTADRRVQIAARQSVRLAAILLTLQVVFLAAGLIGLFSPAAPRLPDFWRQLLSDFFLVAFLAVEGLLLYDAWKEGGERTELGKRDEEA